ncbi:MAG: hypothetical protein VX733_03300 [Candidatus Latescibacterota bacterium]|nr:hypothetical protein [Candidatus Latescibacterota bacterium]
MVLHGREAKISGSWDYVLTHDDEYVAWVMADGASEIPSSDANPFYLQYRGVQNPILYYPTVVLFGRLARLLGDRAIGLLPLWKIGMPFVCWLTLWWCLTHFWGANQRAAACASLAVLSATLLLHGGAQFGLLRFSRPGDALWLVAVWVSAVFNPQRIRAAVVPIVGSVAVATVILSPYYAVFGTWATIYAGVERSVTQRDRVGAGVLIFGLGCAVFGFAVMVLTLQGTDESGWMQSAVGEATEGRQVSPWPAALFLIAVVAVLVKRLRRGMEPWALDAVLIGTLAIEPLAASVNVFLGKGYGFDAHRYYYLPFELLALGSWITTVMRPRGVSTGRPVWEWLAAASALALEVVIVLSPSWNFLRVLPRDDPSSWTFDNSLLLLELVPILALVCWIVRRPPRWLPSPAKLPVAVAAAVAMCLAGYATRPSQLEKYNREMPFVGAHGWLSEHASADDVVLTLPPQHSVVDYVPLLTKAKVYYNAFGQDHVPPKPTERYRKAFYFNLYLDLIASPDVPIVATIEEKLDVLELDYILISRGEINDGWRRFVAPNRTPVTGTHEALIRRQLGSVLTTVYEDERSILWLVERG